MLKLAFFTFINSQFLFSMDFEINIKTKNSLASTQYSESTEDQNIFNEIQILLRTDSLQHFQNAYVAYFFENHKKDLLKDLHNQERIKTALQLFKDTGDKKFLYYSQCFTSSVDLKEKEIEEIKDSFSSFYTEKQIIENIQNEIDLKTKKLTLKKH